MDGLTAGTSHAQAISLFPQVDRVHEARQDITDALPDDVKSGIKRSAFCAGGLSGARRKYGMQTLGRTATRRPGSFQLKICP